MLTLFQAYLFSWHHLQGYINRLDIRQGDLASIAELAESSRSATQQHRPLQVKRSRLFDLTDAHDRLEFMAGVAAMLVDRMARYTVFGLDIKDLFEIRGADAS